MSVNMILRRGAELRRVRQGPLGPYQDRYAKRLIEAGFARGSIRRRLWATAHLSLHMERKMFSTQQLDEEALASFLSVRTRYGRYYRTDPAAVRDMLALLREVGASPPPPVAILSPDEEVIAEFHEYLIRERGLADRTIERHLRAVRMLDRWRGERLSRWATLSPADIMDFVEKHVRGLSRGYASNVFDSLRAFIRYLHYRGEITADLAGAIPGVGLWKLATLPPSLDPHEVQRVLDHCDRNTALGRRDYAILVTLARLGLRACEVTALTLDDIDWHAGLLHLSRTKSGGSATLPLPKQVGQAIADYLQHGRPRSESRAVFLRQLAPHQGLRCSSSIGYVVRSAIRRADVQAPRGAAHLFRNSLATQMLRNGASLRLIGELLRHKNPDTTRIYAKVDLTALRQLALPWPGGAQ